VNKLVTWISDQLDDEKIFPAVGDFPKNFKDILRKILSRMFRVYSHLYHSHWDKVKQLGAEIELVLRPTPHWRFVTSYLYSDAEILDAPQQRELEGNRLAQVPESQGSMTLEWNDPSLFSIGVMGRFVDEQFEDDLNSLELGSSVVVDVAIHVPVGERFNFFAGVENVFDEEIESGLTADGLLTVGTPLIVHGGVRLRLGPRS
jgi:outer membrane receptor for ferrienterochelin and colicin